MDAVVKEHISMFDLLISKMNENEIDELAKLLVKVGERVVAESTIDSNISFIMGKRCK